MTTAHETSDAFSDETLREQAIFQRAKDAEMKEMLGNYADGQIEFYKAVSHLLSGRTSGGGADARRSCYVGHGGMGQDYTSNSAHTRGRLIYYGLCRAAGPLYLYRAPVTLFYVCGGGCAVSWPFASLLTPIPCPD